jgi:hypothetical protein
MATKVFISYRRSDSAGHAGRVHDRLARELGRDLLFMDVDAVPLGANFVKVLADEVAKCDVLLAIIGPTWSSGRLSNSDDYVRIEIAAALKRGIPVIPILLDNTPIPSPSDLPDDLKELAERNGLNVRHASFHADLDKLIRALKASKPTNWRDERSQDGFSSIFDEIFGIKGSNNGGDVRYELEVAFLEASRGVKKRVKLTDGSSVDVMIPKGIENGTVLRLKGKGASGNGDALIEIKVRPKPWWAG